MPKYRVLRPIEHDQKLHVPKTKTGPDKVKSASHGQEIPVDVSGTIELNDGQAQMMCDGQIEPISRSSDAGPESERKES